MYYIRIENDFIKINEIISELEQAYLEIDNNGKVIREIGRIIS